MPELEGVPVEEEGVESPLSNAPIMDLSVPPLVEKASSRNASYVIPTPSGAGINRFHPDEMVAPIFGPNAPFLETTLGQFISQFGTTSTVNVSVMDLTQTLEDLFPTFFY